MNNYNDFYTRRPSPLDLVKSLWLRRKSLFIAPAILTVWTLLLFINRQDTTDPEFTLEPQFEYTEDLEKVTLLRNPTAYEPVIFEPLPRQRNEYTWPSNIHYPMCLPKIFVYPNSPKMGSFQMDQIPEMGTNYISEEILLYQLRDKNSGAYKNYVTENPEEADFFYIPFLGAKYLADCWFTQNQKGSDCDVDEKYVEPMMNHIQQDYPYWNRSMGADHLIVHPMDKTSLYYKSRGRMMNATFLTTIGDKRDAIASEGRYRRYKDITITSATALLNLAGANPSAHLAENGMPLKGDRDIFLLFGGRYKDVEPTNEEYSAGIRSLLLNGLDQQPDNMIAESWSNTEYVRYLTRAKYGLAPQGYTLDTTRIWEYIAFGVVPVVIADGILEPFEDDLDWSSFVVKIPRSQAHRMDIILRSIPAEEYEAKRKAVWDHARHTLFNTDIWNLIVRSLCRMGQLEGKRTIRRGVHETLDPDYYV